MISRNMLYFILLVLAALSANKVSANNDPEQLHPQDHRRTHRHNTNAVFWQRIGDQIWAADYGNPCRSGPDAYESEAYDPEAMISTLNIENREEELRSKAGNLLTRLRHLERFVPIGECSHHHISSLPRLPLASSDNSTSPYFNQHVLEQLYNAFLYVSVHYRFMAQDWELGASCYYTPSRREAVIDSFKRSGQEFEHGMCTLLAPVSRGSPYPNANLQNRVYDRAMHREVLHYFGECQGRIMRDCIVHRYAENILRHLLTETTKIVAEKRRRSTI